MEELKGAQLNDYLSLKIDSKQKQELIDYCKQEGYSVGKFVRKAIEHLMETLKDKK